MPTGLQLREAMPDDVELILYFIKALAEYEKLLDSVEATPEILKETLFGKRKVAETILAFVDDQPAGFALFFHNFSTFLGRPGLYLEDLFVKPEFRGHGVGQALLKKLSQIAVERNCGRLEWWVLDWNEKAIRFYKQLGAVPMDEWTVYRLTEDVFKKIANS
jgi:GNAT superfamily N-acetyltransferase